MKKSTGIITAAVFILLYIIIGSSLPFIRHPRYQGTQEEKSAVNEIYSNAGDLRAGIIETNADALAIRLKIIEDAREKIVLSTFDIRPGKSSDDIFSALLAAADRGVKVRILVDGLYGTLHMAGESEYYAAGTHPNIEIRFYNVPDLLAPWTLHGRLHDKYLLVDNRMVLLGGRNTFDYFLGEYGKNASYDREVLLYQEEEEKQDDTVIQETYDYFEGIWNQKECKTVYSKVPFYKKGIGKERDRLRLHYLALQENNKELFQDTDAYTSITVPVDNAVLLTNPTHIYAKEPVVFSELVSLMKNARERVLIQTPYAVFSKDMYRQMEEAVKLQPNTVMLLNSTAVGDNFMASSDYTLNRKKLLKTGINLYEFHGSHSTHGKSMVIDDDLSVVMSYNFDMRSTYIDTETALVIRGGEFNKILEYNMEQMNKESVKVNADESYAPDSAVEIRALTPAREVLFSITSVVFQLFRFLL